MSRVKLFILTCFFFPFSYASTFVVSNTNDSGIGSLRAEIDSASEGDTIRFRNNLISNANAKISLNSEIAIDKSLTIIGLYNKQDTLFVSGRDRNRIFSISSCDYVVLYSMFLIEGKSTWSFGGAITIRDSLSSIIIRNSFFKDNWARGNGGAIHAICSPDSLATGKIEVVNS